LKDDEVQMTLHRAARGVERAEGYWRAGGPKTMFMFEVRLAIKRLVKVWWHGRRSKALTAGTVKHEQQ
jgi:hypothetical protein